MRPAASPSPRPGSTDADARACHRRRSRPGKDTAGWRRAQWREGESVTEGRTVSTSMRHGNSSKAPWGSEGTQEHSTGEAPQRRPRVGVLATVVSRSWRRSALRRTSRSCRTSQRWPTSSRSTPTTTAGTERVPARCRRTCLFPSTHVSTRCTSSGRSWTPSPRSTRSCKTSTSARAAGCRMCTHTGRVRHTEFWARMNTHLGPGYAQSWALDQHLAALDGRTARQALDAGVPPRQVWHAVWEALGLPASER